MRTVITLFILFGLSMNLRASGEWIVQGGRSTAMGLTSVATSDCWSANNNQAGMAFIDKNMFSFYFENRFLIKEMSTQSACFNIKTQYGTLGASLTYSGNANYNTTKTGIAYALKIGSRFSAGIQLDYLSTILGEDYGKHSNVTFDAGILFKINEQLSFGVHAFNPLHVKLSDYNDERIPATMNAGFRYAFSDKFLVNAEALKNSEFPMEFHSGAEYKLNQTAYARIGLCTNPARYTFGFGLEMKRLVFDISSSVHQQLGYSPQISFQYSF